MRRGVILYGPPASGKDTVTVELSKIDASYGLYRRLKCGLGRSEGYQMVMRSQLANARLSGDVVWENKRYDAIYVVERQTLLAHMETGIPVVHLGQPEAVATVKTVHAQWLVVYLWCPRDIAATRISSRRTGDDNARLAAWDATPPVSADLRFDTSTMSAPDVASAIHTTRLTATGENKPPKR